MSETESLVRRQAKALAQARVDEAEAFLRFRLRSSTDGQAKAQAIVETGSIVDYALAEYEIAIAALRAERRGE